MNNQKNLKLIIEYVKKFKFKDYMMNLLIN